MQRRDLLALLPATLAGCAVLGGLDPLKVTLAGVETLPGQGLELRLAVKLRVMNPNDTAVDFNGVAVDLEVRGMDFASGVSDAQGSVPRFGEMVLTIPVTVSGLAMLRQAISLAAGNNNRIDFIARGKLSGLGFGSTRFETRGSFELPTARAPAAAAP
jgi:LEA14-like dessication related protein